MVNKLHCRYCNYLRSKNLKEKCPNCGRRNFVFFGYRDAVEIKSLKWMIIIMSLEVLLALSSGFIYFLVTQSKL